MRIPENHQWDPLQTTIINLIACCLIALAGCSRSERADNAASPALSPAAPAQPPVDACALLTAEEMASIQGQPYQEAKPSVQSHDGFTVSQCYFALPTPSDSVVLNVTQATAANAPALRQQWDEMFRGARSRTEKGEQGESSPPRNIPGLGEQAYWKGSAVGGALHVLFGQTHFRISVGGPGDTDAKIDKSEALAKFILKRLQPQQ